MRTTFTVFTCCRCQKEQQYEHGHRASEGRDWGDEWAAIWPETLVPLDSSYPMDDSFLQHVCFDCLTELERERLTNQRAQDCNQFVRVDPDDDFPF